MTDRDYMERAIELAELGRGWTNPNPVVGAVIVKDNRIIGEGYHARCGGMHAERDAVASLTEPAQGATMYVTLEPCCHYGKTPPCTKAILEQEIARVVVGSRDPNPKVAGKGVKILREAGVVVEEDFMREECDRLNPVFFHYITTGLPYVAMKYAMTADGKIATKTGASKWITGEAARMQVQNLRHSYMAIMVGIGTVLADDPMLNVRLEGKKSPIRVVCDSRLRIPPDSRICRTAREYPTIIACGSLEEKEGDPLEREMPEALGQAAGCQAGGMRIHERAFLLNRMGIEVVSVPDASGKVNLKRLMRILGNHGIDSILLEGGGELNDSALRAGIVQEVNVFVAPKMFGGRDAKTPVAGMGVALPGDAAGLKLEQVTELGEDLLLKYRVRPPING